MRKIKVVQIASNGEFADEYLDDKGRVWYQEYVREQQSGTPVEGHYEWRQLELPEDPEEITAYRGDEVSDREAYNPLKVAKPLKNNGKISY